MQKMLEVLKRERKIADVLKGIELVNQIRFNCHAPIYATAKFR